MNILFVGNSFTFFFDVPSMVSNLARENGIEATVHSVTKGGRRMIANLTEGDEYHEKIKSLLAENTYDALILQEQSNTPITSPDIFEEGFFGVAAMVGAKRNILYSTWGYEDGHAWLSENGMTSREMEAKLRVKYEELAKKMSADISPVGALFSSLSGLLPLYDKDKKHQSYTGSAISALTHYTKLFGHFPASTSSLEISEETKKIIKEEILKTIKL